jgi:hypothetical protein
MGRGFRFSLVLWRVPCSGDVDVRGSKTRPGHLLVPPPPDHHHHHQPPLYGIRAKVTEGILILSRSKVTGIVLLAPTALTVHKVTKFSLCTITLLNTVYCTSPLLYCTALYCDHFFLRAKDQQHSKAHKPSLYSSSQD